MAEVEYIHLCDYAFVLEGGKPGIIGVFQQISARDFPVTHPVMCVAIQFQGQAHELVRARIELARPNGDVIAAINGEFTLSPEGMTFVNLNMINTVFPEPGRYAVRVLSDGRTLVSQSLRVLRVQARQAGPAHEPRH